MKVILKPGDQCFFIKFDRHRGYPGEDFNAENYEVISGTVAEINSNGDVIVESPRFGREPRTVREVFRTEDEAESFRYRCTFENLKAYVIKCLQDDDLPRDILRPNFSAMFTSNPLRITERNFLFGAPSNAWGSEVSLQKIILLLSMTVEDVQMLARQKFLLRLS
jgi:hypothetical protein